MRHSLTPPTRKSEGRGKRLSRKHQGEIYVTRLLRKCWSPRKLIVRWKVAVEMKRCGSSSLFIFLCRARPQEKFTSNNNLQDKFCWDNVLRYIWRIMSFNWWYVALDSMVDRLKEFETAQLYLGKWWIEELIIWENNNCLVIEKLVFETVVQSKNRNTQMKKKNNNNQWKSK